MKKIELPTLVQISAQLLTQQISDNPDDYPKKFPKWVLRIIEDHNNRQTNWATNIKRISDELKKKAEGGAE